MKQKILTSLFETKYNRSPVAGDSIENSNKKWQFSGKEWIDTDYIEHMIDSRDVHIRYLESILRKASEFQLSPKKSHNICVVRKKPKGEPVRYYIKKGYNNYITKDMKDMKDVYEVSAYETSFNKEILENGKFFNLLDAINIAEKYIDQLEANTDD